MSSEEHHKSGMMDKLFHHKDKHADEQSGAVGEQSGGSAAQQSQGQPQQHGHKESEKEKFENYMKKDKEMEAEGKEYGGLM